jgi:DNA-binding transcriptional LysR family regulator
VELRHLQYFLAVAETRHFGQAAERLHMARSPLSQAIRQLENHVGARLFERTTRRVELTSAGESLLRDARRIVAAVETSHRLAGVPALALADLREEDFVVYSAPGSVVNAAVTQACLSAGYLPRRTHEAAEVSIILTQVAAGLGVAVLPESVLALHVDGVRFVPVTDDVSVDLALAWREDDDSPALARLLQALEAHGFLTPDERLPASPESIALGGAR